MRNSVVIRVQASLILACLTVPLGAQTTPLSLSGLVRRLQEHVAEDRIRDLAKQRCLAFTFTPSAAAQLRQAGASEQLVRDLGSVCSRVPAEQANPPRAVARPPSVEELISRGDRLRSRGDYAGALPLYRQAAEREARNAAAHDRVGLALRGQRLWSEALTSFERAAGIRPDMSEYHTDAASALNGLRRFSEAETRAREAVRLNPRSAQAHYQLSVALAGRERPYDAQEALSTAFRIAPSEYADELDQSGRRLNLVGFSTRAFDIPDLNGYVQDIWFYSVPVVGGSVPYRFRFPRDSTKSVAYNIGVRHTSLPRTAEHKLVAVFYRPGGGEWFRDSLESHVSSTTVEFTGNRGFDSAGKWPVGIYRVDFLYTGERVASSAFEIVDTAAIDLPVIDGRVTTVRFFEAGADPPLGYWGEYRFRFFANMTRRVYVAVYIDVPERNRYKAIPLQFIYYRPDGGVMSTVTSEGSSEGHWISHVSPVSGDGAAGKWVPGRYRVDVMSGSRRVTSGWFDIY